jgi:DNA-binding NtrC family response regulator
LCGGEALNDAHGFSASWAAPGRRPSAFAAWKGYIIENSGRTEFGERQVLRSYQWPGNVRELENVIQRAIILARGNTFAWKTFLRISAKRRPSSEDCLPGSSFEQQLRDYKVRLAANAIRESNGNKTLA